MCNCRYSSVTGRLTYLCTACQGVTYRYHGELTLKQLLEQRPELSGDGYFERIWWENARKTQ